MEGELLYGNYWLPAKVFGQGAGAFHVKVLVKVYPTDPTPLTYIVSIDETTFEQLFVEGRPTTS